MYEYQKKIIAFLLLHFSPKFIAIMQYFNNTESYWIIAIIALLLHNANAWNLFRGLDKDTVWYWFYTILFFLKKPKAFCEKSWYSFHVHEQS